MHVALFSTRTSRVALEELAEAYASCVVAVADADAVATYAVIVDGGAPAMRDMAAVGLETIHNVAGNLEKSHKIAGDVDAEAEAMTPLFSDRYIEEYQDLRCWVAVVRNRLVVADIEGLSGSAADRWSAVRSWKIRLAYAVH